MVGVCHGDFARHRGLLPFPVGRQQRDTLGLPQWKSKYLEILHKGGLFPLVKVDAMIGVKCWKQCVLKGRISDPFC